MLSEIIAYARPLQVKIIVDPRVFFVFVSAVTFIIVAASSDIVLRFSIAGLETLVKLDFSLVDQAILALLNRDHALELLVLSNDTIWIDTAKLICLRLTSSYRVAPFISGRLGGTLIFL